MKMTLIEMVQDKEKVPKSTKWARANKDKVRAQDEKRKGTLDGKLINLASQTKYRAKGKGWEHDITTGYLRGLYYGQEGLCALSGMKMTIRGALRTHENWMSISADRIDSEGGYTQGNVQLVCTGVNKIKGSMTDEEFIKFCSKVVEHNS